jgi:hypothetical protein
MPTNFFFEPVYSIEVFDYNRQSYPRSEIRSGVSFQLKIFTEHISEVYLFQTIKYLL